ncbi:hypothetical protein AURDEDRAFT_183980 [Auricularia subglabra TFB-10046 SS5]|nr:hypothetical protein AURDEDRAFT_183980 [Auricularia subglabra TFB-10046 SS5]
MLPSTFQLPADVLRMIFELLAQSDVLAAAAVSRAWRASAVLDVSYYRAHFFIFDPRLGDNSARIGRFADVVSDAEQRQYRLSLRIVITGPAHQAAVNFQRIVSDSVQDTGDDAERPASLKAARAPPNPIAAAWSLFHEAVVPLLRQAVPLLVRLDADVCQSMARVIFAALTVPAPRLRSFAMDLQLSYWDRDTHSDHLFLPADLFACSAPLLRTAELHGEALLRTAPQCLVGVCALDMSLVYEPGLIAAISASFPHIEHLRVHSLRDSSLHPAPLDVEEFAAFAHLQSLYLGPDVIFVDILPVLRSRMSHIDDLEICCNWVSEEAAPLLGAPVPQVLELHESVIEDEYSRKVCEYRSRICLRLKSATTVRCVDSETEYETVFSILRLASLSTTLTDLSLDDRLVRSLLEACPALPALERLSIILVWWSYAPPHPDDGEDPYGDVDAQDPATRPPDDTFALACPRLATLTLHGTRANELVPDDVLRALARVLHKPHLVLANSLSATADGGGAFASVRSVVPRFQRTPHVPRAHRLLWTGARVRRAQPAGAAAFDSWWMEGFDFDSSGSESDE